MTKKGESTTNVLPTELILEILKRFPVRDVLRFRCLSKQLCDEIDSAGFTKAHLNQSKKTRSRRKLGYAARSSSGQDSWTIHVVNFTLQHYRHISLSTEACSLECVGEIYGCCNGLILFSSCGNNDDYDHSCEEGFLWLVNPSTRRCKKVEPPPCNNNKGSWFGFGYDSIGDDYKFVQIQPPPNSSNVVEICVYSFASETWTKRNLEITFNLNENNKNRVGVLADGALHWWLPNSKRIVSFDLFEEKFVDLIPSPPSLRGDGTLQLLQDYGGESHLVLLPYFHIIIKEGESYCWRDFQELDIGFYTRVSERLEDGNFRLLLATQSYDVSNKIYEFDINPKWGFCPQISSTFMCGKWQTFFWETLVWPRSSESENLKLRENVIL